jgi:hypothetical protein
VSFTEQEKQALATQSMAFYSAPALEGSPSASKSKGFFIVGQELQPDERVQLAGCDLYNELVL